MSDVTGSMGGARSERGVRDAGLVLLYAPNHQDLPPVFPLDRPVIVFGRSPPEGGYVIPQVAASRVHARVALRDDRFVVTDLDSRNGVLVCGKPVRAAVLEDGDDVRIGDAVFEFVADGAAAYAKYRIGDRGVVAPEIVGGVSFESILAEVARVAPSEMSVLILGESGTGKELVARAIHAGSKRRGPLCALNCAALPPNLVESELFGVKRGAFTGAERDRPGIVRAAHGGTLFLDEIGDLPLEAQAKLLRLLQTHEVVPLGAAAGEKVDVRIVCATHRDLATLVKAGGFRGDLFARIDGYSLTLPPLRARKEDLYRLVRHFSTPEARVSLRFMLALTRYAWPYNVRELEAAMKRAVLMAEGAELDERHLPAAVRGALDGYGESNQRADIAAGTPSAEQLRELLTRHDGNVAAVARACDKDRRQVHRWLRHHGISPDSFRRGSF